MTEFPVKDMILRPHILMILAAWAAGSVGAPATSQPFSFENPPGPRFTELQKRAQRDRAAGIVPMVKQAYESGAASVTIPAGNYRFGKEAWGREGVVHALQFRGMKRDADHPLRIIARDVTFWFDLPADQAPTAHFALGLVDCSHVTIEGLTLDRDPRGCMEGRVTRIDDEQNRVEIIPSQDTLIPTAFSGKLEQRIIPFKADGKLCTALYGVQHMAPVRLQYSDVKPSETPGRYWVCFAEGSKFLTTNRDPNWVAAYGDAGTLRVGDGLCLVYSTTLAISVINCTGLSFIGVNNYITKGCVRELGGGCGHLWKDCYFGPRPGTCQWQGADGILTGCMQRGSTYDGILMQHTTDDLIDIHGFWGYVEKAEGRTIQIQRDHQMPAYPGDALNFFDKQTGLPLGNAAVERVDDNRLTLDRESAAFADAVAENPSRQNNGFVIRNSTFIDCYQRLLVQGGNGGTIRDSRFIRIGSSIELQSNFFTRNEGGICRDIAIENNLFEDVAIYPNGVTLTAGFAPLNRRATLPLLSGLTVRGNVFRNTARGAISLDLALDGKIDNNSIENPHRYSLDPREKEQLGPIQLNNCLRLTLRGNKVINSNERIDVDPQSLVKVRGSSSEIVIER